MSSVNPPDIHRQQVVAGKPVYVQGVAPSPVQGGRMPMIREGNETREAREQRGQRSDGAGFMRIFIQDSNSRDSSQTEWNRFDSVKIRNQFVRKVYMLLFLQLLVTFGFIILAINVDPTRIFLLENFILLIIVACLTLLFTIAIMCCRSVARNFPCNIICLFIFTCLEAYLLAALSCLFETSAVYMAAGTCAIICFLVSVLACQIKWDITQCGCILYILLIGLFMYMTICSILVFFVDPETFRVLELVYGGIGLAVFILYLMFDTQLIMGGRRQELSPEDYIIGALSLYVDVIMIFYYLLLLFRTT